MKRDMDLYRKILLEIEKAEKPIDSSKLYESFELKPEDEEGVRRVEEHLALMKEAMLIEGHTVAMFGGWKPMVSVRITHSGHDFLDSIRNDEVWQKTMSAAEEVGTFGLDLIKELAKGFAKTLIKKHTGMEI